MSFCQYKATPKVCHENLLVSYLDNKQWIKTPTREGYEIYRAYKIKMQKRAEEEKMPQYMLSKFKDKDGGNVDLKYATNGSNFS